MIIDDDYVPRHCARHFDSIIYDYHNTSTKQLILLTLFVPTLGPPGPPNCTRSLQNHLVLSLNSLDHNFTYMIV